MLSVSEVHVKKLYVLKHSTIGTVILPTINSTNVLLKLLVVLNGEMSIQPWTPTLKCHPNISPVTQLVDQQKKIKNSIITICVKLIAVVSTIYDDFTYRTAH